MDQDTRDDLRCWGRAIGVRILTRSEVYSGVYGRASVNLYAFKSNGSRGIACSLNNLQKIRDGAPPGGKDRADEDDDGDFLS